MRIDLEHKSKNKKCSDLRKTNSHVEEKMPMKLAAKPRAYEKYNPKLS